VLGLWLAVRVGWQRLSADVTALARYEERYSQAGEADIVLAVQDPDDPAWIEARQTQVEANLPAPLPAPALDLDPVGLQINTISPLLADWVRADVSRQFEAEGGERLAFVLPQFYRRLGPGDWVRAGVPSHYWGQWFDWQGERLVVRHSERDRALVERIAPQVDGLLGDACALWGEACAGLPAAQLYFSNLIGSLDYDPLANVEVHVEFSDHAGHVLLPAGNFISVPSPQLAGLPADEAAERYYAEYLAVKLIADLASAGAQSPLEAHSFTARAVDRLNLGRADPGFASLLPTAIAAAPAATPTATAVPVVGTFVAGMRPAGARPIVVPYVVQEGDTLWAIAARYSVTVGDLVRLNGLADPDLLAVGTILAIPVGTAPPNGTPAGAPTAAP
jgi:LysM repeat protein